MSSSFLRHDAWLLLSMSGCSRTASSFAQLGEQVAHAIAIAASAPSTVITPPSSFVNGTRAIH